MLQQLLRRSWQRFEAASADRELPVCPGVSDRNKRDRYRMRATLGDSFRHHRNPDARCHHLADRIKISQTRPDPKSYAQPRGMSGNVGLKRRRISQRNEIIIGHLHEIHLAAVDEIAASRRHQDQAILTESKPLKMIRQGVLGRKAEIGCAACDRGGDIGTFALLDIETDIGMFAQERCKRPRQMLCQPGRVGKQMHAGPNTTGERSKVAAHHFDIVYDKPGVIAQGFASRGQLNPTPAALEQSDAKIGLQTLDPGACGCESKVCA